LRRFVDDALLAWKNSRRRKPLLVRGARQVGKTYSIEKLGRDHFGKLVTIDLERNREWHRIFAGDLGADHVLHELEVVTDTKIEPGSTLLFLDEIQACPRVVVALRYLYEERPDLHVIAAGSLLELAFREVSFPVGRVQFLEMHPMTFVEFLWAIGADPSAELVLGPPKATSEAVHNHILEQLRKYCFVGGMPGSVSAYVGTHSIRECFGVHKEIIEGYRDGFSKYAPHVDPLCIDAVLRDAAQSVGTELKYARLAEGHDHRQVRKAFDILCQARLIKRVPSANPGGLPLGATSSARRFKTLLLDIGLWQHLCGIRTDIEYLKTDLLAVYRGAMAEQFVGQEMLVSQEGELYYWSREARGSSAEVDYLAVVNGEILPVEVKSGPAGRLKSMNLLLSTYPNCPRGLVFSSAPYADMPEHKLTFLPLYFAGSATTSRAHRAAPAPEQGEN
jgi:hypothetical protein